MMSIKQKIRYFVIFTVMVPIIILFSFSYHFFEQQVEKAQQSYLTLAMTFVVDMLANRSYSSCQVGRILCTNEQFIFALKNNNTEYLNREIEKASSSLPFLDNIIIVDKNNNLLASSYSFTSYKQDSVIGRAAASAMAAREERLSEEVIPLETLFVKGSFLYESLVVNVKESIDSNETFLLKALVGVNIVPVYDTLDKDSIVGAIILLDAINNELMLPATFSSQVKDVFLAISVDEIRVCSNITTGKTKNYVGSRVPNMNDISSIGENVMFGRQYFAPTDEYHVFMEKDIYNSMGQKIAMIGIGIPENRFKEIMSANYGTVALVIIVVLAIMLLIGSMVAKQLSLPILKVIQSVECFARLELHDDAKDEFTTKDEILKLSYAFRELVNKLANKEKERKEYLQKLFLAKKKTEALAKELKLNNEMLEATVNERTLNLQDAIKELKKVDVAKSNFMANISHEFRTPINIILGSAEMLEEGLWGNLTQKQSIYVQNIKDSGNHLLQLINDTLDISKMATGKMILSIEPFSIGDAVDQSVNGMLPMANERNISIKVKKDEEFIVNGDIHKFLQIMYNLLSNSVKFTKKNGNIDIIVHKYNDTFQVCVRDDGIGIPLEDQERVFSEFEQVENCFNKTMPGTGLGLPIVKKLIELQGGNIVLRSKVDLGTEVIFILPIDINTYLRKSK